MNCPRCQRALPSAGGRCLRCEPTDVPVEGALAPDLARGRARAEPLRELPGRKRRERTWQDEVRERVDKRRNARHDREPEAAAPALPLFPDDPPASAAEAGVPTDTGVAAASESAGGPTLLDGPAPDGEPLGPLPDLPRALEWDDVRHLRARHPDPLTLLGDAPADPDEPAAELELAPRLSADRLPEDDTKRATVVHSAPPPAWPFPGRGERPEPAAAEDASAADDGRWLDEEPPATVPAATGRPVERPAQPLERLQAALVDASLLLGLSALVVYFTTRVTQVPLEGLRSAWLPLSLFLVGLGLCYATYFTGTTGQTLGKIALGLRVVDTAGQAPGYGRALGRCVLAVLGAAAAGVGPGAMFFDPARRALHDRAFRTRVVALGPR